MTTHPDVVPPVPGEVSLEVLAGAIIRFWWLPPLVGLLGGLGAYMYARSQTPIYRAEALVAPVQQSGADGVLGSIASQFGGLGQLAGLSAGRSGDTQETLALLRSRQVAADFIAARDLLPVIFPERWEAARRQWRQEAGRSLKPTTYQAVVRFGNSVRLVEDDKLSGHITVAFELPHRDLAAELANSYVRFVNDVARNRAVADADLNLRFLRAELQKTDFVELRAAINRLVEAQAGRKMLAATRPDFALRVLDPAVAPDPGRTVRPRKILFAGAGLLVAGSIGLVLALVLGLRRRVVAPRDPAPA